MGGRVTAITVALLVSGAALAQDLSFDGISARHPEIRMSDAEISRARGEGECLAGIKQLSSLPADEFEPNIEWLNFRSGSLLSHMRPCEVLVLLEAAHDALETANAPRTRASSSAGGESRP